MIYGVSGITDVNLREGLEPTRRVFDKSKTNMEWRNYLHYCKVDDTRQIEHIINRGERVLTRPAKNGELGIEMVIEKEGSVLQRRDFEPLLHAMNYPLYYKENYEGRYGPLRPLLMGFVIGEHKISGINYVSERLIGSSKDDEDNLSPKNDFDRYFGYHLEPGIVKVHKVLEIVEEEEGHSALSDKAMKPFKLLDVSKEFGISL